MNEMDKIHENIMRKHRHLYYNFKKDKLVCVELQNWVPENKLMYSLHNKERCMSEIPFESSHIYIGEVYCELGREVEYVPYSYE